MIEQPSNAAGRARQSKIREGEALCEGETSRFSSWLGAELSLVVLFTAENLNSPSSLHTSSKGLNPSKDDPVPPQPLITKVRERGGWTPNNWSWIRGERERRNVRLSLVLVIGRNMR